MARKKKTTDTVILPDSCDEPSFPIPNEEEEKRLEELDQQVINETVMDTLDRAEKEYKETYRFSFDDETDDYDEYTEADVKYSYEDELRKMYLVNVGKDKEVSDNDELQQALNELDEDNIDDINEAEFLKEYYQETSKLQMSSTKFNYTGDYMQNGKGVPTLFFPQTPDNFGNMREKHIEIMKEYNATKDPEKKAYYSNIIFQDIHQFIIWLMKKKGIAINNPLFTDVYQECCLEYAKNLPKFDPTQSGATAYFCYCFTHAISTVVNAERFRDSAFYNIKAGKVLAAQTILSIKGLDPEDVNLLSIETGFSINEVENSLLIIQNTNLEVFDVFTDTTTAVSFQSPESMAILKNIREALVKALNDLSDIERTLFIEYYGVAIEDYNLDDVVKKTQEDYKAKKKVKEKMSYTEMSKKHGIDPKKVQSIIEKARRKLYRDPALKFERMEREYEHRRRTGNIYIETLPPIPTTDVYDFDDDD